MYKHWYLFHTSMCVCQHPFILLLFGTYVFVQASNTVRLWSSEPPISWSTSWILECVESQRLATTQAPKGWIQGMDMIPWYPEIFSCGNGKSRLFDRIHLQLVVFFQCHFGFRVCNLERSWNCVYTRSFWALKANDPRSHLCCFFWV